MISMFPKIVGLILLFCIFVPCLSGTTAYSLSTPFSATSFWNTPLPDNAPLHPNSSVYVQNIVRQVRTHYSTYGDISTYSYTPPIYVVPDDTPPVKVRHSDCTNGGSIDTGLESQFAAVPIPADAVPSEGTDSQMVIYQPSSGQLWDFWRGEKRVEGWYTCWGGRIQNVSNSQGIFKWPYGATATGLPFLGGIITIGQLQSGSINHALGIGIMETRAGIHSWPANRHDGWVNDENAVAEGQRFRLPSNLDLDSMNMHPVARMIAKAVQKYGLVIWDTGGYVGFGAENPARIISKGLSDPYIAIYDGTPSYEILKEFPWEQLQALAWDYGMDTDPPVPPSRLVITK